jgi:hypothetical protein
MNEWRDFSRLPESPDYWRELHGRVARAAQAPLNAQRNRQRWLDRALAAGVLAAAASVVLLLALPHPAETTFQASLAPDDPVALELLSSDQAPSVSGLLAAYTAMPR